METGKTFRVTAMPGFHNNRPTGLRTATVRGSGKVATVGRGSATSRGVGPRIITAVGSGLAATARPGYRRHMPTTRRGIRRLSDSTVTVMVTMAAFRIDFGFPCIGWVRSRRSIRSTRGIPAGRGEAAAGDSVADGAAGDGASSTSRTSATSIATSATGGFRYVARQVRKGQARTQRAGDDAQHGSCRATSWIASSDADAVESRDRPYAEQPGCILARVPIAALRFESWNRESRVLLRTAAHGLNRHSLERNASERNAGKRAGNAENAPEVRTNAPVMHENAPTSSWNRFNSERGSEPETRTNVPETRTNVPEARAVAPETRTVAPVAHSAPTTSWNRFSSDRGSVAPSYSDRGSNTDRASYGSSASRGESYTRTSNGSSEVYTRNPYQSETRSSYSRRTHAIRMRRSRNRMRRIRRTHAIRTNRSRTPRLRRTRVARRIRRTRVARHRRTHAVPRVSRTRVLRLRRTRADRRPHRVPRTVRAATTDPHTEGIRRSRSSSGFSWKDRRGGAQGAALCFAEADFL